MNVFALPIRRPVATSMFFLGIGLLGGIAAWRLPVELLPPLEGNRLHVSVFRPGSEPEVVEREVLLPLAARASELAGVDETWGGVRGPVATFTVRFETGTDLKVRELELRRIAAELGRSQPPGTRVDVEASDLSLASRFVMVVAVHGRDDLDVLRRIVDERIRPRLAAVAGVSQAVVLGGSPREVTAWLDPDRAAALGVTPQEVFEALRRSVGRQRYLGGAEQGSVRAAVVLDGRTRGLQSLADTRVSREREVLLRHIAKVELGIERAQSISRVDGKPTVVIVVFQEEGANLVRLGRTLRRKIDELSAEHAPLGIGLSVSFDGSELVEQRLERLKALGASGFLVALLVLFLFLRQWMAVAVVGVAVPISLLVALCLLYLGGQSLNLITIFGLAVGIGMLVDNSIVVYEAVQRRLERGATADGAAEDGVRRTVRAILAASITNAVVFLPVAFVEFDDAVVRSFLKIATLAILLPLVGSVLVAVGLVPLLARRLAAPAALDRLARARERREEWAGKPPPDRAREVFTGLLVAALRRPAAWVAAVVAAVLLTVVVGLPLLVIGAVASEAPEANPVQLRFELPADATLEQSAALLDRVEGEVRRLSGIERIESFLQENNARVNGSLSVYLRPRRERPEGVDGTRVREAVRRAAEKMNVEGLEVRNPGDPGGEEHSGGGGDLATLLGGGPSEIVLSGPDAQVLDRLAGDVREQIASIPEVHSTSVSGRRGQDEVWVIPDSREMSAFGLTADGVLPALGVLRREKLRLQAGFTTPAGEEIPLAVGREPGGASASEELGRLRLWTPAGVLPISAVSTVRRMPSAPQIQHHNGRREVSVFYTLGTEAPQTGPAREALEQRIEQVVQSVGRPAGYTIETPSGEEQVEWFKRILIPAVGLLFAVLAITFESLTLPILVLVALPLTVLGAVWGLALTGTPADPMALVGALTLIGVTVNPAILLVDRMQERVRTGFTPAGAAALAAVRERVRPVLMTTATTVAGLWPLALATGEENEVWPPFARVVMGGLVTSTVLTLLVIPVGFVMLVRLDRLFGRLGPWILLGWAGATAGVMAPLIWSGLIASLTWRLVTTGLVAGTLLGLAVLALRRPERPEPASAGGPPPLEARYLKKIYGEPGPVGRAWRLPELVARRVLARGGRPFDPARARERIPVFSALILGPGYLAWSVGSEFWRLVFLFAAVVFGVFLLREVRRARGLADILGRVEPGGPEEVLAFALPWIAVAYVALGRIVIPAVESGVPGSWARRLWLVALLAAAVLLVQQGRRTAVAVARGELREFLQGGRLRRARTAWRRVSRRVFGLDLPREEVRALTHFHFRAERGMIGILGPNGAGKTTLLRQLAGILEPSIGRITIGGVPLGKLRRNLARHVGYLPQEFGLPMNLTAREYLDYHALLYEMKPAARRRERVDRLLQEVGLAERADDRIGTYSGGMRQRVAVARTLLRLPSIIIVDEPTVGLDPRERIRFRNLLSRLAEGRVVLFSTHVVEDVAVACERVVVLAGGRMVFDGEPARLAGAAEGLVWKARLSPEEESRLPADARVVDHVPEQDGRVRMRILCSRRPHASAEPESPSLEDGYLVLTSA